MCYHDWTKGPQKEEALLKFKEIDIVVRGELHLISGQTATCKSLFALDILSACINVDRRSSLGIIAPNNLNVLLLDTEQSVGTINMRVNLVLATAVRNLGLGAILPRLTILKEDSNSPQEVIDELTLAVQDRKPDIVIIDGVVDLTENFNDPRESRHLVQLLRNLAIKNNLAVLVLIHENPHSDKARGHLGTILLQKCWRSWSLERLDSLIRVSCVKSRGESHLPFAFGVNPNLTLYESEISECVHSKLTCKDLIIIVLRHGPRLRSEIYRALYGYRSKKTIDVELAKLISSGIIAEHNDMFRSVV